MAMTRLRKRALALAVAAGAALGWSPTNALADDERLDHLFAELAEPEREDWMRIEAEIVRELSRSGSDAMDLLLRRGRDAIDIEHWPAAVEHLSALIDHAPDFAEGWFARATAFHMMDEHALALADLERVLALEPRHFAALARLGMILESMGEHGLALEANRAALALHPNRPEVARNVERLERQSGDAEL
jgi:tetratricopeptide (TPR) repeat protein